MSFDDLVNRLSEQRYPPVDRWTPEPTGDMDLCITAQGDWIHEGEPITRASLVKLLASVLRREGDDYFLVSPVEKYRITVEDAPFLVVEVDVDVLADGERTYIFRNNVDDLTKLSPEHRLWTDINASTGEPRPYLHVRHGLNALINRSVYYQLVNCAKEQRVNGTLRVGIACGGAFYPLD